MTNLVYYQPWSLLNRWHREIDELFSTSSDASQSALPNNAAWSPSVDLQEESDRFVLRADVPGVSAKKSRPTTAC
jgi:HSP20 family protein